MPESHKQPYLREHVTIKVSHQCVAITCIHMHNMNNHRYLPKLQGLVVIHTLVDGY